MNLALALIVMALVLYQGAPVPAFENDPVVVGAFGDGSVAKAAGLEVGDRISGLDGYPVYNWKSFWRVAPFLSTWRVTGRFALVATAIESSLL